jgi:hypothetical protein
MSIKFTPIPSNPDDITIETVRIAFRGNPARALAEIIRENNRRAIEAQSTKSEQEIVKEAV